MTAPRETTDACTEPRCPGLRHTGECPNGYGITCGAHPWIRPLPEHERKPLDRDTITSLRTAGLHAVADIGQRILDRRERRLRNRLRRASRLLTRKEK